MKRLVEIRAYRLKASTSADFERTFTTRALPLLQQAGIDVVAFGASPHAANAWFLIRAFDDLADLTAREEAFYASDAWRRGPREAIVGAIDDYLDTLLWMSDASIDDLRRQDA